MKGYDLMAQDGVNAVFAVLGWEQYRCNNIGEFSFNGGLMLNTGFDVTAVPLSSLYIYHLLPLLPKHCAFPLPFVAIIRENSLHWYSQVVLLT